LKKKVNAYDINNGDAEEHVFRMGQYRIRTCGECFIAIPADNAEQKILGSLGAYN
jgi:hypothetical protein